MPGDGKSFYTVADTTAPTVQSVTIASDGTTVTIVLSEAVTGNSGFTITPSGGAATLTYSSGSGTDTLVFTASRTIYDYETATWDYTPGDIKDLAGNVLAATSGAVTNNSAQFSPLDISGLALWLDSEYGLYQERSGASATTAAEADGDPVGTAACRRNTGDGSDFYLTTDNDANRPTLKTGANGLNNLPVLQYDGGGDFLSWAGVAVTDHTIMAVDSHTLGVTNSCVVGADSNRYLLNVRSTPNYAYFDGTNNPAISAAVTANTFYLTESIRSGTDWRVNRNGAQLGIDETVLSNSITISHIGSRSGLDIFFQGKKPLILIYNRVLTSEELTTLRTWINERFSVY